MTWTQAICERCWIAEEATWENDVLVSIRRPMLMQQAEVERCSWCGEPTILGAYKRADPASVRFPRIEPVEAAT